MKKIVKKKELIQLNEKKRVICLLTHRPTKSLIELFNGLEHHDIYDMYVLVDDNEYKSEIEKWKDEFKDIRWIYVKEEDCEKSGYKNLNFFIKNGIPSAWDKVMYYFCENMEYNDYWFMEDDVFIPKTDSIYQLDKKYKDQDVLLKSKKTTFTNKNMPPSHKIEVSKYMNKIYEKSLCKSMICIVRMSKKMLQVIKEYVEKYKTMFFLEYFVCTLSNYHKLKTEVIEEFSTIIFRKVWSLEMMMEHPNYMYHPIKNVNLQRAYRKFFEPNEYIFICKTDRMKQGNQMKRMGNHLIQTVLLKSKEMSVKMKVSEEWSENGKKEDYTDYCKIFENDKKVFYYRFDVPSIKEATTYMHIQGYEFESFYMIFEEKYQYGNVSIKIVNIPNLFEFVKIESDSKEECRRCFEYLGLKEEEKKSFEEIVKMSNKNFDLDITPKQSLEFDQMKDFLKRYVKRGESEYKKLMDEQLLKYEKFKSSIGSELKIYNEREVKLWM